MLPLLTAIVICLSVIGLLYVLWRPHWAVLLIIVMFPLEQLLQSYVPVLFAKSWIINVTIGSVALFAVLGKVARGERLLHGYGNPVTYMGFMLYVIAWAGLLWTPSPGTAYELLSNGLPYHILGIVFMPLLIDDLQQFRRLLTGLMLVGTIIAILIMANPKTSYYAGRMTIDLGMYSGQKYGRGNPLALAELGGMMAIVAALARPRGAGLVTQVIRIAALVFGLGLAIGSGSRGQVLGAVVAGVVFFPMARRVANPSQFFLVVAGFGAVAVLFFVTFKLFIGDQNIERWSIETMILSIGERFDRIFILLSAFLGQPAKWPLGLGPNAFAAYYHDVGTVYVHNVVVEILCEEGLLGAAMLFGMMWFVAKGSYRTWQSYRDDDPMRSSITVLVAIAVYSTLLAMKQGSFLGFPQPFNWYFVLGLLCTREQLYGLPDARRAESAGSGLGEYAIDPDEYAIGAPS